MSWPLVFVLCGLAWIPIGLLVGQSVPVWTDWNCKKRTRGFVVRAIVAWSLLPAFVTALVGGLATGLGEQSCLRYGRELGVNASWELIGGCYVEVPNQGRLVPQSWIVPVIEGNRMRIDINAPGGASPTETTVASEGLIVIPNPNGDGSFIVVPQG